MNRIRVYVVELACSCIFVGLAFLTYAQPPVYPSTTPTSYDLQFAYTFTSATPGPAIQNYGGAASWRLTFTPSGFTAATVQVETAEDCSGSPCPTTWQAVPSSTVTNGANPVLWTASPVVSTTVAFKFHHPWFRINPTSVTGTGTLQVLLLGYKGVKPE